jgi:hypothetical protein
MVASALRRRAFLRAVAASTLAGAGLPGCFADDPLIVGTTSTTTTTSTSTIPTFLTVDERAALSALVDVILPPDADPGASTLGVVDYIELLLTAFEYPDVPRYYLGGPFSGRVPYPDATGAPSSSYPPSNFGTWLPLDRYADAEARLYLYGSAGLQGGGPNDAALGPTVGLRDTLRDGLQAAMTAGSGNLSGLDPGAVAGVYNGLSSDFQGALVTLVTEGAFAAPEYGGNAGGGGWKIANFPGDVLPLGYSFYDTATGQYRERADAPVSTADPGPDPAPLDADTLATLDEVVMLTGGEKFS